MVTTDVAVTKLVVSGMITRSMMFFASIVCHIKVGIVLHKLCQSQLFEQISESFVTLTMTRPGSL